MSAPRGHAPVDEALEVNRFWFGPPPLGLHTLRDREKLWFGVCATVQQQAAIDEMIRERFAGLMERAAAGALGVWAASPHRRLALILLLDQFPRNAFRGTARAFATDERALALALSGIQAGADAPLSSLERLFLCMPLQHAERLDVQEESVAAYRRLLEEAPVELRPFFAGVGAFAERHHSIVRRFGRFPHRNATLGRASTPEEQVYLASRPDRFGQ